MFPTMWVMTVLGEDLTEVDQKAGMSRRVNINLPSFAPTNTGIDFAARDYAVAGNSRA